MSEDFSKMSAAVDRVTSLINEAVAILQNPQTDNNQQDVIDAITLRLNGAADALSATAPVAAATAAPATTSTETPPVESTDPSAPAA